jgi:CRP-like cAMP-binding protein
MSLSLTARALHCEGLGLGANHVESKSSLIAEIPNSRVCETLDDALIFAEDVLIALQDPSVLRTDSNERFPIIRSTSENINVVKSYLETLCHGASANDIDIIYTLLSPEKYLSGDIVWQQGAASESLKLVVEGSLISLLDDEHGATESIFPGSTIGELGLLNGVHRLTTVKVISDEAILYSLSKEKWEFLTQQHPRIARYIDLLVIRYLSHRVQHVSSSNILDRRSLPV